jgi:DNA polymerase-4
MGGAKRSALSGHEQDSASSRPGAGSTCGQRLGDHGHVRNSASILHLDLDAFFASVEQRDKPSLRGKPVVVGGTGPRGVVATASYEARRFGIRSAMSTSEARSRCPHAAFLGGRFDAYQATSAAVMGVLRALSPLVEPLSLDEAFVDLTASPSTLDLSFDGVVEIGRTVKQAVHDATGGLTASVGIATSKLIAKIASDLEKPDGLVVIPAGSERDFLRSMQITVIPGVGPATAARLREVGVTTVAELEQLSQQELTRLVGQAHGLSLHSLARAVDNRPVVAERETKSISVEDTFESDIVDPVLIAAIVDRHARMVSERLARARLSGRTVTLKIRYHDFATQTRSSTLAGPTDRAKVLSKVARDLLSGVDTTNGVRLLGVGVSSLTDWVQDDLFWEEEDVENEPLELPAPTPTEGARRGAGWRPGMDVVHDEYGPGWVWGSGLGRVTVRFETSRSGPGPIRTFATDDAGLHPGSALPPTGGD